MARNAAVDGTSLAEVPSQTNGMFARRAVATGIGNFMEWFDFAIYGYFASVIGVNFFPKTSAAVSLISSLGVFAVGFLSRPLGAVVLGPIGDRHGRRTVLVTTVIGMGISTALMGIAPTYNQIGIFAPILLIFFRLIQGFMVGGEWSTSGTYLVESAPSNRRAVTASIITGTAGAAFLSGTALAALITATMSAESVSSFGWRIPFVLAFVLSFVALYIRMKLNDTPVYSEIAELRTSGALQKNTVKRHTAKPFWCSVAFSALFGVSLFYLITYANTHLTTVGMPRSTALGVCSLSLVFYVCCHPFVGLLSDRIGRRKLLIAAGTGISVLTFPVFALMNSNNFGLALLGLILLAACVSVTAVLNVVLLVEIFPADVRSSLSAISYNVAFAVFAGPASMIAAGLAVSTNNLLSPGIYLCAIAVLSTIVIAWLLPETYKSNISLNRDL